MPKTKKEKLVTFGKVLTELEAKRHYGMVYGIKFTNGQLYIGSKCFYKKGLWSDDWKTYTSSSKPVNKRIEMGEPCEFYIIKLMGGTKQQILAEEYATIRKVWTDCKKTNKLWVSLNYSIGGTKRGW